MHDFARNSLYFHHEIVIVSVPHRCCDIGYTVERLQAVYRQDSDSNHCPRRCSVWGIFVLSNHNQTNNLGYATPLASYALASREYKEFTPRFKNSYTPHYTILKMNLDFASRFAGKTRSGGIAALKRIAALKFCCIFQHISNFEPNSPAMSRLMPMIFPMLKPMSIGNAIAIGYV